MTIHEAIDQLKSLLDHCKTMRESGEVWVRDCEALDVALAALRGPTREQVEKVWRGEWIGSADGYADGELVYDIWECSECGYGINEEDDPDMLPKFCPKCYAAMTDEAVEITLQRLEALHENDR